MKLQCTACWRKFCDDTGSLPDAAFVHCVFCGAAISLDKQRAVRTPTSAVPFSNDCEREEGFALGVIGAAGSAFPDTLRQFRAHGSRATMQSIGDSLLPLARGSESASERTEAAPWRLRSFWLSLCVGFGVGALVALGVSAWPRSNPSAAVSMKARAATASSVAAAPLPSCSVRPAVAVNTNGPSPRIVKAAAPTPVQERRWLLERARAEQRQYHVAQAESWYRRVLARAPRDSEAIAGLGELELLRGRVELADDRFREALEVNANYLPAQIALADIRWQSGRIEEAREAYRSIVERYTADLYPPYVALRAQAPSAFQASRD